MPFLKAAKTVLGTRYDVSVVIVTPHKMKSLNRSYRGKNSSTDILAFPLSKNSGEIFISPSDAAKKAKIFGMRPDAYAKYLVIHALVHLKGYDHGKRMTGFEKHYCRKLGFPFPEKV